MAAADRPFIHFSSADAVVNAAPLACAAPFTTKESPGSAWNVAAMLRSGLKSCAYAKRLRRLKIESCIVKDLSVRIPSSLRVTAYSVKSMRRHWRSVATLLTARNGLLASTVHPERT